MNKKDFFCITPFIYSEVYDKSQYLCCPSWLKEDIYETDDIYSNFYSDKSNQIRESILDGSYKYCDEVQCPYLASIKNGKPLGTKFKLKSAHPVPDPHLSILNMCFDRSCNLQCPTCRNELINYLGNDRIKVENKLKIIEEKFSATLQTLYLSGTADPFYSKSFRQFLINFDPTKYRLLRNIHLHTNGLLWTENLWNKMKNIHKYVKSCEVSIDAATKNTYENKVRIGGNWNELLERLDFIINIQTIKSFTFSFVVQDSNFREMEDFCKLIYSLNKNQEKKINIFFNNIDNWGTYTQEQFDKKNVSKSTHPLHNEFLKYLYKIDSLPFTSHNLQHLIEKKSTLI